MKIPVWILVGLTALGPVATEVLAAPDPNGAYTLTYDDTAVGLSYSHGALVPLVGKKPVKPSDFHTDEVIDELKGITSVTIALPSGGKTLKVSGAEAEGERSIDARTLDDGSLFAEGLEPLRTGSDQREGCNLTLGEYETFTVSADGAKAVYSRDFVVVPDVATCESWLTSLGQNFDPARAGAVLSAVNAAGGLDLKNLAQLRGAQESILYTAKKN